MIIHLLKKWFSKDYRDTMALKKMAQIENEFEQIFIKISEMYSQGRDCHTYIDMPLKGHRLDGSWLTDNFYFDLYKKDKRLGRIYVGPNIFLEDPPVKWLVFNNELRPKIIFERDAGELTSTDLAHAINAIAPGLLTTWFCKGDRMISINIEPIIPLPIKKDK